MVVSIIAACTEPEPQTVTVIQPTTVTNNITTTVVRTTTFIPNVVPEGPPPQTPHSLELDYGNCFSCHIIPLGHEGRHTVEAECAECHVEAPQSEWTYGEGAPGT